MTPQVDQENGPPGFREAVVAVADFQKKADLVARMSGGLLAEIMAPEEIRDAIKTACAKSLEEAIEQIGQIPDSDEKTEVGKHLFTSAVMFLGDGELARRAKAALPDDLQDVADEALALDRDGAFDPETAKRLFWQGGKTY